MNNNNQYRPSTTPSHRACLPPSSDDEFPHGGHPSELDLLLAQARVGSHEYYASAVTVRPFHSPATSPTVVEPKTLGLRHQPTSKNDGAEEDPRTTLLSPSVYYTPAERPNNYADDNDGDDTTTEREGLIKIASDDEMEENSSGDDEGSGVLVEKPSSVDEMDTHHLSNHTTSASTSTALTATKTPVPTMESVENSSSSSHNRNTLAFPAPPKLRFFTDHQSVPTQLQQLQLTAARKRHEFQTNLHQLHCQTAQLTADLAQEQMDCHVALRDAVATGVYQPLQQAFERMSHRTSSGPTTTTTTQWLTLEQRVDQLDAQMTHARHVQLPQLQQQLRERIRIPNDNDNDHVAPTDALAQEWHDEDVNNTKSENSVARQWESLAGTWARRYQEERAARIATTETLAAHVQRKRDGTRGQELLQQIATLHAAVEEESVLRRAEDARVMQYLQQQCAALQSAILEAYPDK